MFDKLLLGFDY